MTGLEALQSVQFVTRKGKRLAILSAEDWEALIEWLETLEDVQMARQTLAALKAAKGVRRRAGWLEWNAVRGRGADGPRIRVGRRQGRTEPEEARRFV